MGEGKRDEEKREGGRREDEGRGEKLGLATTRLREESRPDVGTGSGTTTKEKLGFIGLRRPSCYPDLLQGPCQLFRTIVTLACS